MQTSSLSFLTFLVALSFQPEPVLAQCPNGGQATPFDATPKNPIVLSAVLPNPKPVFGQPLRLEATGPGLGLVNLLGISAFQTELPLSSPFLGSLLIGLSAPGTFKLFDSIAVPQWVLPVTLPPGTRIYAQSLHLDPNGCFLLSSGLTLDVGTHFADLGITDIDKPANPVGGVGPLNYQVTVVNSGSAAATTSIGVAIGSGPGGTFGSSPQLTFDPYSTTVVTVSVPTPASFGGCGQSNSFSIEACTGGFPDCDSSNNCRQESLSIAVPYWDLDLGFSGVPNSAFKGTSFDYNVTVKNLGNIPSPNVCLITGVNCSPGSQQFGCNLGTVALPSGTVNPGATKSLFVNNYFISPAAFSGTQYMKAEVHYSAGCFDNCNAGNNNFAQQSIQILP